MTCWEQTPCARITADELAVEPVDLRLSLVRGTDNELEITITDGDGKAVVISSDTITLTVKDDPGGTVQIAKSNGPGDHFAPELGQTLFEIDKADTIAADPLTTTYWVYEVRRITGAGDERVHIAGDFVVRPTI